ncbi:MAG: cupin domain-containing protein [Clostridia bacterium]|nr:cupin domain-containing protein [Clostridia bacterium]
MIKRKNEIKVLTENNASGNIKMYLSDLGDFEGRHPLLDTFFHVRLKVGEEVALHPHNGEFESYYIIKGKALYNDNGEFVELSEGDVTHTPSGSGHGIKNIGDDVLEFIALVVKDC